MYFGLQKMLGSSKAKLNPIGNNALDVSIIERVLKIIFRAECGHFASLLNDMTGGSLSLNWLSARL